MKFSTQSTRRLLMLAVALVSSAAATVPAPAARAAAPPFWIGWGLTVAFPNDQLEALYTVYVGSENPTPRVIASSEPRSIADDCVTHGTLQVADGVAEFDGSSTYIRCELPAWRDELAALMPQLPQLPDDVCICEAGAGPLFVAADARLGTVPSQNPVFESEQLRVNWSLPTNGVNAQSRVRLSSGTFQSPPWPVQSSGNRVLTGQRGPAVVAVASQFGWLDFLLDKDWKHYFATQVVGPRMGHWTEAPSAASRTAAAPYELGTQRAVVYIGHSPTTGAYFDGALRYAVLDPGCTPPA